MTQEENDMLQLLHWRLGLCSEVLKGLPALAQPLGRFNLVLMA
jgi:hypothetical protein